MRVLVTPSYCPATVGIQLCAMDFFSDTQEAASRFADYIEDLRDVFRCNGVDFGSAEDFFAFARTLRYHSDLRGDVLRVVKSVMDGETNVSFRTILTIIAVASGGAEVATSGREMSIPVKLVIESLIGVGACRQLSSDYPDGLYSELTLKETARDVVPEDVSSGDEEAIAYGEGEKPLPVLATAGSSSGDPEVKRDAGVSEAADAKGDFSERVGGESPMDQSVSGQESLSDDSDDSSVASNGPQSPLNDYGGSDTLCGSTLGGTTLAESLTRLELNSLQLKIYLDSIDQRISRMEPRLENVAPIALSTAPLHAGEEGAARYSAIVLAGPVPAETISGGSESQASHGDPQVLKERERAANAGGAATGPSGVPGRLRAGYSSRRRNMIPALVGVAMVLVAASLFWIFGRDADHTVVKPVNASAAGVANAGRVGASDSSAAADGGAPAKGSQRNYFTPAYSSTRQGISRPPDASVSSSASKRPAQSSFAASSLSESPAAEDAKSLPEMATERSEAEASAVRTYKLSSVPPSNRLVNVSSGVMAANLLSGPKPSYPTLASLTHTQGNVVMQAVISKSGTVEELHVIKGHRLLRGAAKNAVRNWRYRPYRIDGVPVDVATTVSVDFSLHH